MGKKWGQRVCLFFDKKIRGRDFLSKMKMGEYPFYGKKMGTGSFFFEKKGGGTRTLFDDQNSIFLVLCWGRFCTHFDEINYFLVQ